LSRGGKIPRRLPRREKKKKIRMVFNPLPHVKRIEGEKKEKREMFSQGVRRALHLLDLSKEPKRAAS